MAPIAYDRRREEPGSPGAPKTMGSQVFPCPGALGSLGDALADLKTIVYHGTPALEPEGALETPWRTSFIEYTYAF